MLTETLIEDDRWHKAALTEVSERAACMVLEHLGLDAALFEISVMGCDDARIAVLNGDFRGKAQSTNVLSWPSVNYVSEQAGDVPDLPESGIDGELGDIAIAYETCLREACDAGKPMEHHILHLMVHGVLHLLGYDHIRDPDATLMERIEVEILGKLGVDNPYKTDTDA